MMGADFLPPFRYKAVTKKRFSVCLESTGHEDRSGAKRRAGCWEAYTECRLRAFDRVGNGSDGLLPLYNASVEANSK